MSEPIIITPDEKETVKRRLDYTSPQPIDLTTVVDLKIRLGVTATITSQDGDLQNLVTQTSADFLNTISRRAVYNATYTEVRDGHGSPIMVLENTPLIAVASLTIGTLAIPAQVQPETPGFVFDRTAIKLIGYRFTRGFNNVKAVYTSGYGVNLNDPNFPPEISLAVLDWAELRYRQRGSAGVSSKHFSTGESINYDKKTMPNTTLRVVQAYKRRSSVR